MPIISFLGDLFNFFLLQPVLNLFVLILNLSLGLQIPGALGFAIILITLIVYLLTWRFKSAQIRHTKFTAEKMAELKPILADLKKKYKDDKMVFAKAQSDLFKEHGVNPAAGCLPTIIQVLPLYPLYQIFLAFFAGEKGLQTINYFLYNNSWHLAQLPSTDFFGLDLAAKPLQFASAGVFLLLIPLLTSALTFVQSRMMTPVSPPVKVYPSDSPKEKKEKEDVEDVMVSMQPTMLYMMPIMIGVFAFQFPVGLAIYWIMLTILSIFQQYLISGWGGMASILNRIGIKVTDRIVDSGTRVKVERIGK